MATKMTPQVPKAATATTAGGSEKIRLKLLVDNKAKRVVFAEANKDFVDFLCDVMSMPINTMVRILKDNAPAMGSFNNIYTSINALDNDYMVSSKDMVLKPRGIIRVSLLSVCDAPTTLDFNACSKFHRYFTHSNGVVCPMGCPMHAFSYTLVRPKGSESSNNGARTGNGYVKELVKYMVLDNLEIKPLTAALIKCHAKNIGSLAEKDVHVGLDEGLAILKASFETEDVLTAVFLRN